LNAHDGEDEPEDEADEQHVEDGGNGLNQGVHDHLFKKYLKPILEFSKPSCSFKV
jgi:hypothetical protein